MAPIQCHIFYRIVKRIDDILFIHFNIFFCCKIQHFDMNIRINIFFEVKVLKSYTMFGLTKWPFLWSEIPTIMTYGFRCPPLGFSTYVFMYPPTTIEFIGGQSTILFTWVIIIKLVHTIWGVPTTSIFLLIVSNSYSNSFLSIVSPFHDPKFVINPISNPPLTTFVLGARTVSTLVIVMTTLSDWVTSISTSYLQILAIVASDILNEAKLIWIW